MHSVHAFGLDNPFVLQDEGNWVHAQQPYLESRAGFFFLPQLTKKLHNTFNAPETPLLIPSNTTEAVIKTTWPNCYREVEEP